MLPPLFDKRKLFLLFISLPLMYFHCSQEHTKGAPFGSQQTQMDGFQYNHKTWSCRRRRQRGLYTPP